MTLKNNLVAQQVKTGLHGFLIGVEVEEGLPLDGLVNKLEGALTFMEGVGKVECQYLGRVEVVDETAGVDGLEVTQGDGYRGPIVELKEGA